MKKKIKILVILSTFICLSYFIFIPVLSGVKYVMDIKEHIMAPFNKLKEVKKEVKEHIPHLRDVNVHDAIAAKKDDLIAKKEKFLKEKKPNLLNELTIAEPRYSELNVVSDTFASFNKIRTDLGLKPVKENEAILKAAKNHTLYMVANREGEHEEDPDNELYFAYTPEKRMLKAGLSKSSFETTGEVLSTVAEYRPEGEEYLLENLFEAIYHRFNMLDPDMSEAGLSVISDNNFTALVIDSMVAKGKSKLVGVAYPFDGQKNVRTYFEHENEWPDPLPDVDGLCGFAISFSVGSKHSIKIKEFTLVKKGESEEIAGKILDKNDAYKGENNFAFIPYEELDAGTEYIAHIKGFADETVRIDYTWSFTTRKK